MKRRFRPSGGEWEATGKLIVCVAATATACVSAGPDSIEVFLPRAGVGYCTNDIERGGYTLDRTPPGGDVRPSADSRASSSRMAYTSTHFDRVDPGGRWLDALHAGYARSARADAAGLALPSDFVTVDDADVVGPLPSHSTLGRTFSYDAIRLVLNGPRLPHPSAPGFPTKRDA